MMLEWQQPSCPQQQSLVTSEALLIRYLTIINQLKSLHRQMARQLKEGDLVFGISQSSHYTLVQYLSRLNLK